MGMFSFNGPVSFVLLGTILAISAYVGAQTLKGQMYLSSPITDTLQASVLVPDFEVGGNPVVQYDRTVTTNFVGNYRVEVKDATTGQTVCVGTGTGINYEKTEMLPLAVTLSWYVGTDCKLAVGQYFLETNYTISQEGLPDRYYTTKSNVFKVVEPK